MAPGVDHGSVIDVYLTRGGVSSSAPGPDRADRRRHHRPVDHRAGLRRPLRCYLQPLSDRRSGLGCGRGLARQDAAAGDATVVAGDRYPMNPGLLTAGNGQSWENELVAALDRPGAAMTVIRRCVDIADVLTAATTGQASVVVLSAELRRLDTDAVQRLTGPGVAVVGDLSGRRRPHRWVGGSGSGSTHLVRRRRRLRRACWPRPEPRSTSWPPGPFRAFGTSGRGRSTIRAARLAIGQPIDGRFRKLADGTIRRPPGG